MAYETKETTTEAQIEDLKTATLAIKDRISEIIKMNIGPPQDYSAARANGYSIALVALLDEAKTLLLYSNHPEHIKSVNFPTLHCPCKRRT
ncbi:hypothetical protein BDW62DRAFT_195639 [Aspergillus aurantiobrunneus]